jgi:hypothetical protein
MKRNRKVVKPLLFCVYFVGCLASLGLSVYGFVLWRESGYRITSWFSGGRGDRGAFHLVLIGIVLFAYCLFGLVSTTGYLSLDDHARDDGK